MSNRPPNTASDVSGSQLEVMQHGSHHHLSHMVHRKCALHKCWCDLRQRHNRHRDRLAHPARKLEAFERRMQRRIFGAQRHGRVHSQDWSRRSTPPFERRDYVMPWVLSSAPSWEKLAVTHGPAPRSRRLGRLLEKLARGDADACAKFFVDSLDSSRYCNSRTTKTCMNVA